MFVLSPLNALKGKGKLKRDQRSHPVVPTKYQDTPNPDFEARQAFLVNVIVGPGKNPHGADIGPMSVCTNQWSDQVTGNQIKLSL